MNMTPRLQTLLDTNPEFAEAFHAREDWALKHAECVLGLDGKASRRHPERALKQNGVTRRNWCGQCPSREGCVMCDLDGHPQVVESKHVGVWED
jgi:hypothetical protein